jgi:predicted enzyme related to lactoylglutathione lyase
MKSLIHLAKFAVLAFIAGGAVTPHAPTQPATTQPKRATGVGGIFFKAKDPAALRQWYATHLGFQIDEWGTNFEWRQADEGTKKGFTQWSPHRQNTRYFQPSTKPFMINYRVENLEWLLAQLKKEGVTVVGDMKTETYGKFGWVMDPEGNRIELWEPNDAEYEKIAEHRTK